MTNDEKIKFLVKKYEKQLDTHDCAEFAQSLLRECGALAFKKVEMLFSKEGLGELSAYIKPYYTIEDDVVFSTDGKELVKYAPEKPDAVYEIPPSVEYIEPEAFKGNEYLTEIVWGKPRGSGNEPFVDCPQLKTIRTNNINHLLRYCCSDILGSPFINGADLYIDDTLCETLVLPEDTVYVNPRMFQGCTSIKNVQSSANNRHIAEAILDILKQEP